jgi:hypothetical protein
MPRRTSERQGVIGEQVQLLLLLFNTEEVLFGEFHGQ